MIQYLISLYLFRFFCCDFYPLCISFWSWLLALYQLDKINSLSAFGTILSAIIAVFAIILTYLTLSEMKRQRETSVQPHLTIMPSEFYITYKKPDNLFYFSLNPIDLEKLDENDTENTSDKLVVPLWEKGLSLSVNNIGLGAAHGISGFWSYPFNDICRHIEENESKKNPHSKIVYIGGNIEHSIHTFRVVFSQKDEDKSIQESCSKIGISEEMNMSTSVSIPISMIENSVSIAIPLPFIEALCLYYIQLIPERIEERLILIHTPFTTLTANLSYYDISNKERKIKYNLDFNIIHNRTNKKWSQETGSEHIEKLQGEIRVYPMKSK